MVWSQIFNICYQRLLEAWEGEKKYRDRRPAENLTPVKYGRKL